MKRSYELLFVLVFNLPQWIWYHHEFVGIGDNIDSLVVFAVKLTYRHPLLIVFVMSADSEVAKSTFSRLHFLNFFRRRVVGDLHMVGEVSTSFTDAS